MYLISQMAFCKTTGLGATVKVNILLKEFQVTK
jgi:hypothetical protein